ncbi:MAG: hypothetical protein ACRCVU_11820 [Flavobacterium sp.]
MKKFTMNVEVNMEDVLYSMSMLGLDGVISAIKELDRACENWETTEELTKHFVSEMTTLHKHSYTEEDEEDKKAWIAYLQSQIDALK